MTTAGWSRWRQRWLVWLQGQGQWRWRWQGRLRWAGRLPGLGQLRWSSRLQAMGQLRWSSRLQAMGRLRWTGRFRRLACAAAVCGASLLMMLVQSGCLPQGETREPEAMKLTLTFRHFWTKQHDEPMAIVMRDVIDRFEAANPHIKVDFEGLDQTVHREQKLKSEMVTGNPPDIFALFGGKELEPYVQADRLLDLSPFLEESGLQGRFMDLSLWSFGSGVYGLPLEGFAEPIYYNKRIFDRLGLQPPRTLDELDDTVTALREGGYVPFALGNAERWQGAMYYHYFLQRMAGPEPINEIASGRGTFLTPEFREGTQRFAEFLARQPFPEGANDRDKTYAVQLFTEGRAGMYLNGSWETVLLQSPAAPAGFELDVGVANFPVAGAKRTALTPWGADGLAGGYTLGLGVSASVKGEKKAAVLELLRAIYNEDVQRRIVSLGQRLPSMDIPVDAADTGPVFAQVSQLLDRARPAFIPYDNALPPSLQDALFQAAELLIDGRATADEALQLMEDKLLLERSSEPSGSPGG